MAAEQDLTRLLTLLTAACSNVLQVERSTIWVVDPEAGGVFTRVAEGMDAIRVPKGKGIVGIVVTESGEPLVIPDAYADPRFNQEIDRQTGFTTRQILCYPLKDIEQKRVVGMIQALNKTGGRNFVAYDTELAAVFAAQAGVVLEQAALREQAIEKASGCRPRWIWRAPFSSACCRAKIRIWRSSTSPAATGPRRRPAATISITPRCLMAVSRS